MSGIGYDFHGVGWGSGFGGFKGYEGPSRFFKRGMWTNDVTPVMRYVVARTICDAQGEVLEPPRLVWEGTDPLEYSGGCGTTKEGGRFVVREFFMERLGRWTCIADPRPIDRQVGVTLQEALTRGTDELDILMENVRLFDEEDEEG